MLGHSGAKIEITYDLVRKTGKNLINQFRMMAHYPEIFPCVSELTYVSEGDQASYVMERLQHPTMDNDSLLQEVIYRARTQLWNQKPMLENNPGWRACFLDWRQKHADWIPTRMLVALYPNPYEDEKQAILCHGDLTLANVMMKQGRVCFIDPSPPSDKIPPFLEVDYAKLMQSALGWESLLRTNKARRDSRLIDMVYRASFVDKVHPYKLEFWTAVHLARLRPYARLPEVALWAEENSRRIINGLDSRV